MRLFCCFFFFSSRRRHTRSLRDWSSDVCSSDLVVSPALTEGPYFVDEKLERSDIRPDPMDNTVSAGAPLVLKLTVSRVANGACTPLTGAVVDVWHCDAQGVYSDEQANNSVGHK